MTHSHGFGSSYKSVSRAPHCNLPYVTRLPSYHFAYPFSSREGTVAYEIDKSNSFFVAFGAEAMEAEPVLHVRALDELSLGKARRAIVALLKDWGEEPIAAASTPDRGFKSHSPRMTDRGTAEHVVPIAEYPVKNRRKTVASLQRPEGFPSVAVVSGWDHADTDVTVSGSEWTDEVMRMSRIVGHQLQVDHEYDQGIPGQFHATHAEKQVIAYSISKHVLVEHEEDELLLQAKPPFLLTRATVLVNRGICGDCLAFVEAVNTTFDLSIVVLDKS